MKGTKFAPPCFVLRQQLEFGDSVRLCPAFRRRPPKGLPLFLRGLRGAAPAPAPFYRQPHGLREVLSFADSSRFGRSASPTRPTALGRDFQVGHLHGGALAEQGVLVA